MASSHKTVRVAAIAVAALGGGVLLPAACLFPDYTFDLNGTAGTGGTPSSSSSTGGRGGSPTTSTSSSTTSSSTSTSSSGGGTGGTGGMSTGGTGGVTSSSTSSSSTASSSGVSMCQTVDCSDPNCMAEYACVPTAPAGWTGPVMLYDGPPAGDPGCPQKTFPTQVYAGNGQFSAPPATCTTCMCGNPTGQQCQGTGPVDTQKDPSTMMTLYPNTFDFVVVTDAACGQGSNCGGALQVPNGWGGACYGPNGWLGGQTTCGAGSDCTNGTGACNKSLVAQPVKVAGGTCTPTTQMPTIPPVTWGTTGDACGGEAMVTTGCNAGRVCAPKTEAPFQSGLCMQKAGNNTCPPVAGSPYTTKHLFYDSASDTRTCSDCTCGSPSGGTCSATIKVYSDGTIDTCATLVTTLNVTTAAGDCKNLTGNPQVGSRQTTFSAVNGGTCTPSGGQAAGMAAPQNPMTFCCIP